MGLEISEKAGRYALILAALIGLGATVNIACTGGGGSLDDEGDYYGAYSSSCSGITCQ